MTNEEAVKISEERLAFVAHDLRHRFRRHALHQRMAGHRRAEHCLYPTFPRITRTGPQADFMDVPRGGNAAKAIDWCADYGLGFDAHNENLPELIEKYGNDCRKIGADFYVDDKNYWPMPEGD